MDEYSALGGLGVDASSLPAAYAVAHCEIKLRMSFFSIPALSETLLGLLPNWRCIVDAASSWEDSNSRLPDLPGRSVEPPPNHVTLLLIEAITEDRGNDQTLSRLVASISALNLCCLRRSTLSPLHTGLCDPARKCPRTGFNVSEVAH